MKSCHRLQIFALLIITIVIASKPMMAEIIVDADVNSNVAGNAPNSDGTFNNFNDLLNNGLTTEGYSITINANIGNGSPYRDVYGGQRECHR